MKLCVYCKSSHNYEECPLWHKSLALMKVKERLKTRDFSGSSPAPFIGRFGYPQVNVGILAPTEVSQESWIYDAPKYWALKNYEISEVINLRGALINSNFKANIKNPNEKFLENVKEIGMASKPVDVDIILKEKPAFNINLDSYSAPTGPSAKLKKIELASNPKINSKVERLSNDEILAVEAITQLYNSGFDENFLTKLLSVGALGLKQCKKMVPTRWSITATDDMLGKHLIEQIKEYSVGEYCAFFGSYLGNYYLILTFPKKWSYELFETHLETKGTTTDFEPFEGRKNYAQNCAGGYYTARLAIAEKLKELKKQCSVLALRFITNKYTLPLGVWVTREASRKTLSNRPIEFASQELMLTYAKSLINKKFGYDLSKILEQSKLLRNLQQKELSCFVQ